MDEPKVEVFYADPVDEEGNVIGTARMGTLKTPWGDVEPTKIPAAEIPTEGGDVLRARLDES